MSARGAGTAASYPRFDLTRAALGVGSGMLRAFFALSVLTLAATAAAQEVPQVYQQQKTSTAFHIDGVTRQEWNSEELTFLDHSRRLYRFKPRVEFSAK